MKGQCSTETGCCETQTQPIAAGSCGQDSSCPVEKGAQMWEGSFCQAIQQVQVDILKDKIRKAWGAKMDRAADAVLEAAEVQWQSMLAQGKAKLTLREKLASLWAESKR